MSEAPATAKLLLFPLCDRRGEISRVLKHPAIAPATRVDALLLAWRLDLPPGMHEAHAAAALMTVYGRSAAMRPSEGVHTFLLRELERLAKQRRRAASGARRRRRKRRSTRMRDRSLRGRLLFRRFSRQPESR